MRIGASGLLAGMAALLMGAALQGEGGTAETPAESAPGEVSGAVKSASTEKIHVDVRGAPDVRLSVKSRTIVVVNGLMATVGDIREGDRIRALYRDVQGEPIAILVDVTSSPKPSPKKEK